MAFARWDPFRDLLAVQQHLDRFASQSPGWAPPVDLYETDDRYVLTAEVPGLTRGDIEIQVQQDRITLSGERQERRAVCEQFHRVERGHGRFSRTFLLPTPVDAAAVTADLADGVLTIMIPKSLEGAARRIHVS